MRGTTSALLLTFGVGFGVYASPHIASVWETAMPSARGGLASSVPVKAAGPAGVIEPATRRGEDTGTRVFSPQQPLFARVPTTPQPEPSRPAVVAADQMAGAFRPVSTAPTDAKGARFDDTQRQLVRDLQRELRRVGCYDGELSGEWSADVRRAMKTFTDRVNARLPQEQPDYILLTLVRGHTDTVCGKGCPSGQAMADGGRCVPKGLLAKAPSKDTVETAGSSPGLLKQGPQPAVRKPVGTAAADRPTSSSSWTTAVAPAPVPAVRPEAASTVAAAPLPGRMTLGVAPITTGSIDRPAVTGTAPVAVLDGRRPTDARVAAAPQDGAVVALPPASTYQANLPVNPEPTPRPTGASEAPLSQPKRNSTRYNAAPRYIPPGYYAAPKRTRSIANRQWARNVFDNTNGR